MAAARVSPTRMELLKLRKRIALANRAYRLLKEKEEALIIDFMNLLSEAREKREKLEEVIKGAFEKLLVANMVMGSLGVRRASLGLREAMEIEVGSRNIMGVIVPVLKVRKAEIGVLESGYSIAETSTHLDESKVAFEEVLSYIVSLAETERALELLGREIRRTRRKVNILEYIILPRLEASAKEIEMKLEELAREDYFRLKLIKRLVLSKRRP
ncbi:MAG: V-type ATP synthase subunit D [Thermoproteota archaeon]|nr:MAG: V-type ATP synthase subunit D [Candidatus Korarchaeota archaeon]RLG56131.1 MAG: V-type ATP synthase subunit D [Candidatus Korarchaeota archaeon]